METDLGKGIFNIPNSVIHESGLTTDGLVEQPALARTCPVINNWAGRKLEISRQLTAKLRHKKLDLPTRALVEFLTLGIADNWK